MPGGRAEPAGAAGLPLLFIVAFRRSQSPTSLTFMHHLSTVCDRHPPRGSVRARASKYNLCSRTGGNVPSRGFHDGQHGHAVAEELESAAIGGNMLVVAGARAEKAAQFIVSAAEPSG